MSVLKNMDFFQLSKKGSSVTINIFGRIGKSWFDDDCMYASKLANIIDKFDNVSDITVFINSNGGDVSEGLAIFNALKRNNAKVTTVCDGFACSAASVIFMAGDERIMSSASLLMIHNAWSYAQGNAMELRKLADDLDKITSASVNAYLSCSSASRDVIMNLMDNESWLDAYDCIELGFATCVEDYDDDCVNMSIKSIKSKLNMSSFDSNSSISSVSSFDSNSSISSVSSFDSNSSIGSNVYFSSLKKAYNL